MTKISAASALVLSTLLMHPKPLVAKGPTVIEEPDKRDIDSPISHSAVDKAKMAVGHLRVSAGMEGDAGGTVWVFPADSPSNAHSYLIVSVEYDPPHSITLYVAEGARFLGWPVRRMVYTSGPTNHGWRVEYFYWEDATSEKREQNFELVTPWWPSNE